MNLILQAIKSLFRKVELSRTHWDTRRTERVEITFDGIWEGRDYIDNGDGLYAVKISDEAPTTSEIIGAQATLYDGGESFDGIVSEDMLVNIDEDAYSVMDGVMLCVQSDLRIPDGPTLTKGVWAVCATDENGVTVFYPSALVYNKTFGELKKLDEKYLPDGVSAEAIATVAENAQTAANAAQSMAENAQYTANTAQSTANAAQTAAANAQTTADSKMNANNPVATESFSLGRNLGSAVGFNSFVSGAMLIANGAFMSVRGRLNRSSNDKYVLRVERSFSEHRFPGGSIFECGKTYTVDPETGTITLDVIATLDAIASEQDFLQLAEVYNTYGEFFFLRQGSNGAGVLFKWRDKSFARMTNGNKFGITCTIYRCEIACEKGGRYIEVVGNGYVDITTPVYSNAYTLDWAGVPWYQGRPQFGGKAQDDGSQTVMANGDKELILASSTEGSAKQFRITVDDTGTITATEVAT